MTTRTGHCLCGAVRLVARDVPATATVCHCRMCQRWTGSAYHEVSVPTTQVDWQGETITVFASSHLGERAFCGTCGSHLYFRVTQEGPWSGNYDIPLGLFDDTQGITLAAEIFVDEKPDAYAIADCGQLRLTRADVIEKFADIETVG